MYQHYVDMKLGGASLEPMHIVQVHFTWFLGLIPKWLQSHSQAIQSHSQAIQSCFQSITTYFVFADHHSGARASFGHCFCWWDECLLSKAVSIQWSWAVFTQIAYKRCKFQEWKNGSETWSSGMASLAKLISFFMKWKSPKPNRLYAVVR